MYRSSDGPVALSDDRPGLRAAVTRCVAIDPTAQRQLPIDVDPDAQVPVAVELGPQREHAVDDEHTVPRHAHPRCGVVDLGDRVEAAQRHQPRPRGVRRLQQEAADRVEVEALR